MKDMMKQVFYPERQSEIRIRLLETKKIITIMFHSSFFRLMFSLLCSYLLGCPFFILSPLVRMFFTLFSACSFCFSSSESSIIQSGNSQHGDPISEDSVGNLPLDLNLHPPFNPLNNPPLNPFNPAADLLNQYRLENLNRENFLFSRIRDLQNRFIEGLPPQLNFGEYEALVRGFLNDTFNIRHYERTLKNEFFDIEMLEMKANLVETLFNLLMDEPIARFIQIMVECIYPEHRLREEALDFIVTNLERLNIADPRDLLDKMAFYGFMSVHLQDLQVNRERSYFYQSFLDYLRGAN